MEPMDDWESTMNLGYVIFKYIIIKSSFENYK